MKMTGHSDTPRVISLKTRKAISEGERAQARPVPRAAEACEHDGGFCRCWMPAWFALAERVGEERKRIEEKSRPLATDR